MTAAIHPQQYHHGSYWTHRQRCSDLGLCLQYRFSYIRDPPSSSQRTFAVATTKPAARGLEHRRREDQTGLHSAYRRPIAVPPDRPRQDQRPPQHRPRQVPETHQLFRPETPYRLDLCHSQQRSREQLRVPPIGLPDSVHLHGINRISFVRWQPSGTSSPQARSRKQ